MTGRLGKVNVMASKKTLWAVIVLAAAAGVVAYWKGPWGGSAGPMPGAGGPGPGAMAIPIEAVEVSVGPLAREVTAVGSLKANESVVVRPEIAGRVAAIGFEEGQTVAKGQALIKLDDSTLAAEREQARANLDLSRSTFARASKLYQQGAGPERTRDESEAGLKVNEAKLRVAQAALDKTAIAAPFDGVVGLRKVSIGAYVQPGQDLVSFDSIDPLKADVRVPEIFLAAVKLGGKIRFLSDAYPGEAFEGDIYAIDPQVDEDGRSFLVRARLPNPGLKLRPGLFVRATLTLAERAQAMLVPEEAITPRGNESFVIVVAEGKATFVKVKTGLRRAGKVEIVDGLTPGQMVVTAGHLKLRDGAPVTVVPPKS